MSRSDLDRLMRRGWTVTDTGCWEWSGSRGSRGYGRHWTTDKWTLAHRLAYRTWVGPIPDGHVVRHKCDNPPCINPDHLEIGTHADNMDDMVRRGRKVVSRGVEHGCSKLTDSDIREIRVEYARGVLTLKMLGEVYGVTAANISCIVNRKTWVHVD